MHGLYISQITPDAYLEDRLKPMQVKPGKEAEALNYNAPRECIMEFFPERKCFTLPKPVKDDDDLQ